MVYGWFICKERDETRGMGAVVALTGTRVSEQETVRWLVCAARTMDSAHNERDMGAVAKAIGRK